MGDEPQKTEEVDRRVYQLLELIRSNRGVHIRALLKMSGLHPVEFLRLVRELERHGIVKVVRRGGYKFFYLIEESDEENDED
ncbi:MAG: hypothetical protein ACTSXJ_06830 [Candidatus Baldrarchaeia archaeon]